MSGQTQQIDLGAIQEKLGTYSAEKQQAVTEWLDNPDADDPAAMLKFQVAFSEWTLAAELESSTLKNIKDLIRGIIQKTT